MTQDRARGGLERHHQAGALHLLGGQGPTTTTIAACASCMHACMHATNYTRARSCRRGRGSRPPRRCRAPAWWWRPRPSQSRGSVCPFFLSLSLSLSLSLAPRAQSNPEPRATRSSEPIQMRVRTRGHSVHAPTPGARAHTRSRARRRAHTRTRARAHTLDLLAVFLVMRFCKIISFGLLLCHCFFYWNILCWSLCRCCWCACSVY